MERACSGDSEARSSFTRRGGSLPPRSVAALPPRSGEDSLYFAYRNFNKRGVVLDLESEGDRERLLDLASRADVLIESFEPGTLERLGLGAAALAAENPSLVYVSVTPFGQARASSYLCLISSVPTLAVSASTLAGRGR